MASEKQTMSKALPNAVVAQAAREELARARDPVLGQHRAYRAQENRFAQEEANLARTAAGFGPVRLSALHAALIAAAVANRGLLVPPETVEGVEGAPPLPRRDPVQVVDEQVAEALAAMMRTTTSEGTARKVFQRDRWSRRSPLREVAVAGKTGSLAEKDPYRDYSWFVGFAPAEAPQIAVATVVVNERLWRIKAPWVAHHALEAYFASPPPRPVALAAPPPSRLGEAPACQFCGASLCETDPAIGALSVAARAAAHHANSRSRQE